MLKGLRLLYIFDLRFRLKVDTPRKKVIFHIDGDAFFVGVEIVKDPKLKGLLVVTGEERGIVSVLS